ncbi:peroxiredoxin family protein [Mucilaginibacter agri]|uniref:Redoxin family protein n=1 Tax=Mucilaginibacter agri TaxID=2695265 RepID=A0A965ZHV9_9SPHI|nr:TlpA disulfide reductase family protein [Mucilaginibacter agri]NCD70274.1 redoxin family protein [Mucilaginibacter agri]
MKFKGFILAILILSATASFAQKKLSTGIWRGTLQIPAGELPFNFTVKDTAGHQQIAIINGNERFRVNEIAVKDDSVLIQMPLFDSEFRLKFEGANLKGNWIRHLGERDVFIPFEAVPGVSYRFKDVQPTKYTVAGRWSAIIGVDQPDTTVAEFQQTGNKVTGTFLTTTGDYRYLEGSVSGDKLSLSCFDGGHAFLFTATLKDENTLVDGLFGKNPWHAKRDDDAKLPDAYSLTFLKPGFKKLDFSFPDLDGNKVSLNDPRFKNKVVIVEIMGSWCPNCMDQTAYLVKYYKKYHKKGVEVVDLAYERTADFNKSKASLLREKNHFNVPYPMLITGYTSNPKEVAKSLPAMANFFSFPTTLIIDKKGDVRKIYTGFSGPGTGYYYTDFVSQFEKLTDDLLSEK